MKWLYIVMAYRYGTNENVFPIGVYTSKEAAEKTAREYRDFRGGKYEHRVFRLMQDSAWVDNYCAMLPGFVK
jgi:hypothetical protein